MKLIKDLSFVLKYYDREDLQHFYEQLQSRIENSVRAETVDNERLSGYIWKVMAVCVERAVPQKRAHTRLSRKQRQDFKDLSAKRICELVKSYDVDKTLSKSGKDNLLLSIFSLKLLIAISEQEELF